jgi:hypothetical protein
VIFCQHMCSLVDSATAIATGYLILSDTPIDLTNLPESQRKRLRWLYQAISTQKSPNACFVLHARHPENSVAASLPVGFTTWDDARHDTVNLDLFRAPDSGYSVYLMMHNDSIHGTGQFWSGNKPLTQLPPDSVSGIRIGNASPALCMQAAAHASVR